MRLSSLYSDSPNVFRRIGFGPGLNVVIAEIRLPENTAKDTHNVGKTTLGRVIDFCLLKGMDSTFFLVKRKDVFGDIALFLELELLDGGYVTVRRDVATPSKASFKFHDERGGDFSKTPEKEWDHWRLAFEKSVTLLDGVLDLRDLKPWSYRKLVGYLLRNQNDYQDVFQLSKFKGKDSDWKPFLAQLLGFDADKIVDHYESEAALEEAQDEETVIKRELGGSVEDLSKIEGLLLLRQTEIDERTRQLDLFDFRKADADEIRVLVDELDSGLSRLNTERYRLSHERKRVVSSLEDEKILFDTDQAEKLFAEAGVLFVGQLRRDFDQLLAFNRAVTEERRGYLLEELADIESELEEIGTQADELGEKRRAALVFLSDADALTKYKRLSDGLVDLRAEVVDLERQQSSLRRLQDLRSRIRALQESVIELKQGVIDDVESKNTDRESMFSRMRLRFNEIVNEVIDRRALLTVTPNSLGHLDFRAEILDERGKASDAAAGNTYHKLLCIALDLAVLRARLDGRVSRFVFHDGVFESLDNRKKENLLAVMREYAEAGVQQVITLIEADVPPGVVFDEDEVVRRLHDDGSDGRLFNIPAW
ncbi:MAG: DUF2326 domain-containing protein [Actinobacteria bacterium HGW-Actinobacteria-7]|jgi:uncharacterized protein YydD (DUF2326 family)|nr:MAG: DUF2326 domain-containing protein [Actinobacteria bacterium HGW-Actinobacteria-7]